MLNAKATFQKSSQEVDTYFKFLHQVEHDNAKLFFEQKKSHKIKKIDDDLYKILKANAFLLLYNLVESTIRITVEDVYRSVNSKNLTSDFVANEIRALWVDIFFKDLIKTGALGATYKQVAKEIIERVVQKEILNLDPGKVKFDGNLDAKKIRSVFQDHGIKLSLRKISQGGIELKSVKDQRNSLAHGASTFTDCGRNFTYLDLERMRKNVYAFLKDILRSADVYVTKERFAATP